MRTPVRIEQGLDDTTVFPAFTDQLVDEYKDNNVKVTYKTYPGVSHGADRQRGRRRRGGRSSGHASAARAGATAGSGAKKASSVALARVGQDHAIRSPLRLARATWIAPHSAAPHEIPASTPSRRATQAGGPDRVLVVHGHDLVDHLAVQHRRDETRPDALDLVRPGRPPESTAEPRAPPPPRAGPGCAPSAARPTAGDRAAGAHAGHEHVHPAVRAPRSPGRWCAGGSPGWPGWRTGPA